MNKRPLSVGMPYSPKAVANTLLDIARESGEEITPMKIQKLVYFAHGWNLALRDEPLINEQVEAWQYGPVIPSLYYEFRRYGGNPITGYATNYSPAKGKMVRPVITHGRHPEEYALLRRIWKVFGGFSPIRLSQMTHKSGTPWETTVSRYKGRPIPRGTDISEESIKSYFKGLSKK